MDPAAALAAWHAQIRAAGYAETHTPAAPTDNQAEQRPPRRQRR
jgi:hypothetical protein